MLNKECLGFKLAVKKAKATLAKEPLTFEVCYSCPEDGCSASAIVRKIVHGKKGKLTFQIDPLPNDNSCM